MWILLPYSHPRSRFLIMNPVVHWNTLFFRSSMPSFLKSISLWRNKNHCHHRPCSLTLAVVSHEPILIVLRDFLFNPSKQFKLKKILEISFLIWPLVLCIQNALTSSLMQHVIVSNMYAFHNHIYQHSPLCIVPHVFAFWHQMPVFCIAYYINIVCFTHPATHQLLAIHLRIFLSTIYS